MIYMFLAPGFEESEAIVPLDIMRRAGLSVTTVGIGGRQITGSHGICVTADIDEEMFRDTKPEMIFPGGMPGTANLDASATVHAAIDAALLCGGYLAAICAAPSVLGKRGLLRGKSATCFPGWEDKLEGAILCDRKTMRDGKILTAKGMGAATEFGLLIVETLCGKQTADKLKKSIIAD